MLLSRPGLDSCGVQGQLAASCCCAVLQLLCRWWRRDELWPRSVAVDTPGQPAVSLTLMHSPVPAACSAAGGGMLRYRLPHAAGVTCLADC